MPRVDAEPPLGGKRKVMVYVPPDLHRAMRTVALDDGRSASDVYAEAARALLASRGVEVHDEPARTDPGKTSSVTMADLAVAVDGLGQRMDEIFGQTPGRPPAPPREAGTKAAEAMKVLLGILREGGPAGLASGDLATAMHGAGVTSGAAETAKTVLRGAGLVRCEGRRWFLSGA